MSDTCDICKRPAVKVGWCFKHLPPLPLRDKPRMVTRADGGRSAHDD